jgi:hypothetical protein
MKQYKVSLPDELYAQLSTVSEKSGQALSETIRERIERSLELDALDEETRDFIDGIALMPAEVERQTGATWHKHRGSWRMFRRMILERLARKEPEGTSKFGARPHQTTENDDPEELGTWAEMQLRHDPGYTTSELRRSQEETYRRIKQEAKGKRP